MPEYLAPGVYVEETSFRSKSIEGVGTSTTGFVGATRYGPSAGEPELMTSFSQFERIYGGLDPLTYLDGSTTPNYLAHAVRNFFDNGGSRLYIARAYSSPPLPDGPPDETEDERQLRAERQGRGIAAIPAPVPMIGTVDAQARTATNTALAALGTAITNLQQARANALTVLNYAIRQVQPAIARVVAVLAAADPLVLDYDYEAGTDPDIHDQIDNWVTPLLGTGATPEEIAALDGLNTAWTTWGPIVTTAETEWVAIAGALDNAATAQADVGAAYGDGVNDGETADLDAEASDLEDLESLGNGVTMAATDVTNVAADLTPDDPTPSPAVLVLEALAAIASTDPTTVTDAVTAITTLRTEATDVVTESSNVLTPIHDAAQRATIERLLAIEAADSDWVARFEGEAGNATILVTGRLGANVLMMGASGPVVQLRSGDLVVIARPGGSRPLIYSAARIAGTWTFTPTTGSNLPLSSLVPGSDRVIPLTLTVEVIPAGKFAQPLLWEGLTVSDLPARLRDSATQVFGTTIANRMQELETPVMLQNRTGSTMTNVQLAANLLGLADWPTAEDDDTVLLLSHTSSYVLAGGNDGNPPPPSSYEGMGDDSSPTKSGLKSLEDLEEIAIVAAPGYSYNWGTRESEIVSISQHLINHCERMRYRVAVLDSPDNLALSGIREYRALLDTTRAALYYPWVIINDPITNQDLTLPPSGFMAGIYARNDVEIGVHKAPANEVVRNAIGLEVLINKAQQDVLNPLGINCIRFFEGRGIRVWGARTISSDPEWKYLNIRRYFAFLEASIDLSTQWAVFEPNGERLWANIRRTVESFLANEWKEGHLAGTKVEEAFFVRCDRSTMTQNDLDNGRLICLIGVAPLYPAEFVIFRIGQWTADRR
ncbi:MAG: phage tail sheath subtilisin-like domain-containing protein [Nodosilinea sp.]